MLSRVKEIADGISAGSRPILIWDDNYSSIPSAADSIWARATVKHQAGGQGSLSGPTGVKRWTRSGTIYVQIFTPAGRGLSLADVLAQTFRSGFEGYATASSVWFRNARIEEVGNDGQWFQTNVIADFEYDELR